ncbi:hypothetical protein [Alkalispirochaeta sphaeroplastigenens]|uniref:hypothetical protein n=1 Tax=Alkalispirochaeta sphaeroplastigenens TaxID=1187066 RepID=UPI001CA4F515|nr:hypothetical protein [Alkalispirochaeta sphaeroplastigenens]
MPFFFFHPPKFIVPHKEKKFTEAWRQVCAYSFPRKALQVFHSSERKTPFEEIEDIEILRFLELGFDVKMVLMSDLSIPVDNPEDVSKVERMILESKNKNEQK